MTDLKDETESPDDVIVCEHERCGIVRLTLSVERRKNGEPIEEPESKDMVVVHSHVAVDLFLKLLGGMQQAVFEEAEWVMEHFDLPPEIIALAVKGNLDIEVREMPND